ncbi:MAG TPA: YetF domain-containing protein [Candidatus Acidoferrum sp.]|nr:YetF domain-containing protein [Candidatus Acidoferrum sp.]
MDSILRGLVIYFFLLLVFRVSGRRTLSKATTFDLVLLLIISEVTQQAMVDSDHSVTNAVLLILTLVLTSLGLSELKQHFPHFKYLLEGSSVMIVRNGKLLRERMNELRVDEDEILEAARASQGLESFEQIKYAFVEPNGEITLVPQDEEKG